MKTLTRFTGLVALLSSSVLCLAGCSTVATTIAAATNKYDYDPRYTVPRVYSGVASDVRYMRAGGEDSGLPVVDLPFSLVGDTIILPYTIVTQCKHGNICTSDGSTNPPPPAIPYGGRGILWNKWLRAFAACRGR
jgi:uncharacterized protein YceK